MFKRNVVADGDFNILINTDDSIESILPPKARYVKQGNSPVIDLKRIPATITETGFEWILRDELNDN